MRASYRHAVYWIAVNDNAGNPDALHIDAIAGYVSTLLVADLFGKDELIVARDILRLRRRADVLR